MANYWIQPDGMGNYEVWTQAADDDPPHVAVTFPTWRQANEWITARSDPDARREC